MENGLLESLRSRKLRHRRLRLEPLESRQLLTAQPVISECMPANAGVLADQDGEYSDWIELLNPSSDEAIDLTGWSLSDHDDQPQLWTFPAVTLDPGQYLVVFASGKDLTNPAAPLHTNFKLDAAGEYLSLADPSGTVVQALEIPEIWGNISYGLAIDQPDAVSLLQPGDPISYHVPTDDGLGDSWTQTAFDDASWSSGTTGIGFDLGEETFAPSVISGNLLWLDATDASTIGTNGLGQFQWTDKSGTGNDFIQPDVNYVPARGTQTLAGQDVLTFDGVDDHLTGPAALEAGDDTYTYFVVWQSSDANRLASLYEQAGPGTGGRSAVLMIDGLYGFNGELNDAHNLAPVGTAWHVTGLEIDNTDPVADNVSLYDNGDRYDAQTADPAALAVGTTGGAIGKKQQIWGEFFAGNLAEIIVYDRILTSLEYTTVVNYLNEKYDLAPEQETLPVAGAQLWLDATDSLTVGINGLGQFQWSDKSGQGNDFTQANTDSVPATDTVTLNGLDVLTFDGVNDYLTGPAVLAAGDDTYTYYAVWQSTDPGRLASIYEQADADAATGARAALLMINGMYGFNGQSNDAHNIISVGTDWHLTGMQVDNTIPTNNNITLFDNGITRMARTGDPASLAVGTAGGTIGKKYHATEGEYHAGNLAEIIVFDRILDSAEREVMATYLAEKYAIDISTPDQAMVHQWTFNDGLGLDAVGLADCAQFFGNATISDGQLHLDGSGDYVQTALLDETLSVRTIMAWVSMNDLNQAGGAGVFGLQATNVSGVPYDDFNSIVYAERVPGQWMNGSSHWLRSVPDNGGAVESSNDEIMLAIVYGEDNSITIYRNGVQYNTLSATTGTLHTYLQNQTVGVFGRREVNSAPELNASIDEARVYNYPLSAAEIADIYAEGPEQLGMIHQWTFNEDADDSVGSADATLFRGAAVADGCLVLDGIDDYARTALLEDAVREKTLVTWVQLDNLTQKSGAAMTIERQGQSPGDTFDAIVYAERTNGQWMAGSNGWYRSGAANNGGAIETSTDMVMLAISYALDGTISIYRNNQLYANYTTGTPITYWDLEHGTSDILFGLRSEDLVAATGTAAGDDGFLAGRIDEARLYNYALSLTDIQAVYAEGPVPASPAPAPETPPGEPTGLVHQWTFNEDADDIVGSADATLYRGAAVQDGYLVLDGTDDYARTALLPETITEKTLVTWVELDNLSQQSGAAMTIERRGQDPGDTFDAIVYAERTPGQWMAGSNGYTRTPVGNGGAIETSTGKTMMAISYAAGGTIAIYRNGVPYATYTTGTPPTYYGVGSGTSDILFGLRSEDLINILGTPEGDDGYLAGRIDEARLYNRVLSATEIEYLYNQGPVGSASDIVATDISTAMYDVNASVYARQTFTIDDPAAVARLELGMYYDDGFIAYINGVEVVRRNAPASAAWNATATAGRYDYQAAQREVFSISLTPGLLQTGVNTLAIHGLNLTADNADFWLLPELVAYPPLEGISAQADYLLESTPGEANGSHALGVVADTKFSVDRGYFDAPFDVVISCKTPGAAIYYSLDGSAPTPESGTLYTAPVTISSSGVLRAAAYKDDYLTTDIDTQTYIFLADILTQPNTAPAGAHWDTEMDPNVVNDTTQTYTVEQGLTSLPTLSISMDYDDLFGSNGIYQNPDGRGDAWIRNGSVEFFYPDQYTGYRFADGFAIDAGVRISGIYSRLTSNPKHSFRLSFQEEYGPSELEFPLYEDSPVTTFDNLVVLNGHNQSWASNQANALYLRDQVARDLQELNPGDVHVNGIYVNLYLNGQYWGQYNLCERPDDSFSANYLGGDKDDYDILKGVRYGESTQAMLVQGTRDAWETMFAIASYDLSDSYYYEQLQDYLDVEQLIDYMIGILYTGDRDGPTGIVAGQVTPKNFYATYQRGGGGLFRFFPWDAEFTFGHEQRDVNVDVSEYGGQSQNPGYLHLQLRNNPEYRLLFADHVYKYFFNDGRLTPDEVAAQFAIRVAEIDQSIVAESARWGDSKREPPYTRDVEWATELAWVMNTFIPQRTDIVLSQFQADGLYPGLDAPEYQIDGTPQHNGLVTPGSELSIVDPLASPTAQIYYTLDGTDPRQTAGLQATLTLIGPTTPRTAWAAVDGSADGSWYQSGFDDSTWLAGAGGVGFDRTGVTWSDQLGIDLLDPALPPAQSIDADADGQNDTDSIYLRMEFDVADPSQWNAMSLITPYDDGLVAYLNGQDVLRTNAPATTDWTSSALQDRKTQSEVMIAIVYGADNTITIYRNGVVYADAASASKGTLQSFLATDVALFGKRAHHATDYLDGSVNEARIYSGVLSAADIAALYAAGTLSSDTQTPPEVSAALAHLWTFNQGGDDLVGPADANFYGGATVFDGSLELDGVDDYVKTDPLGEGLGAKTLIAWVTLDQLGQVGVAPLAVEDPVADKFDAIVFGERITNQWMAGSTGFTRSVVNNGGAAETISENSTAAGTAFDLSAYTGLLHTGTNLLAIQLLGTGPDDSDMFVNPTLEVRRIAQAGVAPGAILYDGGTIAIDDTTTVKARVLDGGQWSALHTSLFLVDVPASSENLVVTELNYHPHASTAAEIAAGYDDADDFEFIEMQNVGELPIDLTGVWFSDGVTFDFTGGSVTTLQPDQYVLVVRNLDAFLFRYGGDLADSVAGMFDNSGLKNSGETITLRDAAGGTIFQFAYGDSGDWPGRADGNGSSLEAIDPAGDLNDADNWRASIAFGGTPEIDAAGAPGVVVNEVLSNTDGTAYTDSIELYNTTGESIPIGGWWLSDSNNPYSKFTIPAGIELPAYGYIVFTEEDFNPAVPASGQTPFALSGSEGDDVWLLEVTGGLPTRFSDHVDFGPAATGTALARLPDGTGRLFPAAAVTLGGENGSPQLSPVILSEVMYHPTDPSPAELTVEPNLTDTDFEFVELFNPTRQTVDLSGWQLAGAVDFVLPEGTTIGSGQVLVVVGFDPGDPNNSGRLAALELRWSTVVSAVVLGPWNGSLDNNGETLRLERPDPTWTDPVLPAPMVLVDRLSYDDQSPWATEPDGQGASLTRVDSMAFGDLAASWTAADPATPGASDLALDTLVVDRRLFYNHSAFDGDDPTLDAADDAALATDKIALLPGQTAAAANYTGYSKGINGLMIDIDGLAGDAVLTAADFEFRFGNSGDPSSWAIAPDPIEILVRGGAGTGDSTRVSLRWADGLLTDGWLQVVVRAGAATGLRNQEVFYFGNAVGETGNRTGDALVDAADLVAIRNHPRGAANPAAIDDRYDIDRDRFVNAVDLILARNAVGSPLEALMLITP